MGRKVPWSVFASMKLILSKCKSQTFGQTDRQRYIQKQFLCSRCMFRNKMRLFSVFKQSQQIGHLLTIYKRICHKLLHCWKGGLSIYPMIFPFTQCSNLWSFVETVKLKPFNKAMGSSRWNFKKEIIIFGWLNNILKWWIVSKYKSKYLVLGMKNIILMLRSRFIILLMNLRKSKINFYLL